MSSLRVCRLVQLNIRDLCLTTSSHEASSLMDLFGCRETHSEFRPFLCPSSFYYPLGSFAFFIHMCISSRFAKHVRMTWGSLHSLLYTYRGSDRHIFIPAMQLHAAGDVGSLHFPASKLSVSPTMPLLQ